MLPRRYKSLNALPFVYLEAEQRPFPGVREVPFLRPQLALRAPGCKGTRSSQPAAKVVERVMNSELLVIAALKMSGWRDVLEQPRVCEGGLS
jgi:hypothetical protein